MSGFDLTLAFGFIALAACLIYALAARGPEVPERIKPEPVEDFGGSWLTAVPRHWFAPDYLPDASYRPKQYRLSTPPPKPACKPPQPSYTMPAAACSPPVSTSTAWTPRRS